MPVMRSRNNDPVLACDCPQKGKVVLDIRCSGCDELLCGSAGVVHRGDEHWHVRCVPDRECVPVRESSAAAASSPRHAAVPLWTQEGRGRGRETREYERRSAQALGGRRLPGSGNRPGSQVFAAVARHTFAGLKESGRARTAGGDIIINKPIPILLEHKRTRAKSYAVTRDTLRKVTEGARQAMRVPGLVLAFQNAQVDGLEEEEWVLVPRSVFAYLLEAGRDVET